MFSYLIILAVFGAMLWLAWTRPRTALLAVVFLAPWGELSIDLALRFTAHQLAVLALCVVMLFRSVDPAWRAPTVPGLSPLLVFIVFGLAWSLIQLSFLPSAHIAYGSLRGPEGRAVTQMAFFLFQFAPVVLAAWLLRTREDLAQVARVYLISATLLAVIGWLQLAIWIPTGENPLPVTQVNVWLGGRDEDIRSGIVVTASSYIYRMNSLAGEPRNLGTTLVLAMMLIQAIALIKGRDTPRFLLPLWIFFALSLVATLSTSAFLALAIGSAVQLPAAWLFRVRLRTSLGVVALAVMLVTGPLALATTAAQAAGYPVIELIESRTLERLESSQTGALEDFDVAILAYFDVHPESAILGTGLGNAHLYGAPYLLPEHMVYAERRPFIAKLYLVRLISEVGFVGLVLFLLWFGVLLAQVGAAIRRLPDPGGLGVLILAGATSLTIVMASTQSSNEFYAMAGVLTAGWLVARRGVTQDGR